MDIVFPLGLVYRLKELLAVQAGIEVPTRRESRARSKFEDLSSHG